MFQRLSFFVAAQLLLAAIVLAQNGGQLKLTGDYTVGSLKRDQNLQGSQPVTYFFDIPAELPDNASFVMSLSAIMMDGMSDVCISAAVGQESWYDCTGPSNGGNVTITWTAAIAPQDAGVGIASVWCALGCNQITTFYIAADIDQVAPPTEEDIAIQEAKAAEAEFRALATCSTGNCCINGCSYFDNCSIDCAVGRVAKCACMAYGAQCRCE
eukprot:TRINITY_DN7416_c0_g1_i1.p1 TRINITY_DN7416_c0_g1~~TRINITY_DN7416_c0_g1_i1.p1  ORF type:complete len:212 (-),score=38.99 TRINITY_DN7416_c0_g1_i1:189-824(-)